MGSAFARIIEGGESEEDEVEAEEVEGEERRGAETQEAQEIETFGQNSESELQLEFNCVMLTIHRT